MEQKYNASAERVFAILTDPKWLEARSKALGELSASVKAKKIGGGVTLTMKRRVRRELPALIAKVLSPESDLVFEEIWSSSSEGMRTGKLSMEAVGQPVTMTADFELAPTGKSCVFRITHRCKANVFLVAGAIEKFALSQIEAGCADEFRYLVEYLKVNK